MVAPMVLDGPINGLAFWAYVDQLLVPELQPGDIVIESWRQHYNTVRPHSALGYKPPAPSAKAWPPERAHPTTPVIVDMADEPTMH